ncbi:MAG: glycosyltransferase family 1 protein [Burkholderiales bacterium]|nr:glycosyltransferase family 1 protein [Burkholderiales bacterium]
MIAPGDTASAAYMVRHALDAGGAPVVELDSRVDPPAGSAIPPAPSLAVVVRYLPRRWLRWVAGLRGQGVPVVYFMDDDLMDPDAVAELPEPYRTRVRRDALRQRKRIEAVCTAFWVSTPQLARKYAPWQPRVVDPRPPRASLLAEPPVWVCYHGSASHRAELDWLLPVMQQVQARAPAVRFEVFGDHAVYARFRALPRVNVLHPMSWPNYLDYTSGTRRDIALAPLLPSRFNAGRGPTKFLDFSRMHAVGLYADLEPYRGFVRDGLDGLLLPPDPLAWVQAVVGLAADAPRRARLAAAARERALALAY